MRNFSNKKVTIMLKYKSSTKFMTSLPHPKWVTKILKSVSNENSRDKISVYWKASISKGKCAS